MHLPENEAVIFIANPRETTEAEAQQLYDELLSADEQERTNRFVNSVNRHDHIVARSLVRLGLTSCLTRPPREWRFVRDEHDRPRAVEPADLPPFQFSLSHTCDLIALLVTKAPAAGLDVEWMQRTNDLAAVAQRICSPAELDSLNELSGEEWRLRFFQLWTLKEAYAKARGIGLGLGLQNISFEIDGNDNVTTENAHGWQFDLQTLPPNFILAVALPAEPQGQRYEIKLRTVRVTSGRF